jgi:hypothetical protein
LNGLKIKKWHFGLQSTPLIPSDVYVVKPSPNILDDDTTNFDIVINEDQWGGRWNCYIIIEYNNKRKCWNKT